MSKEFWHTKTLFIQAGKYKWSYKFDHCKECGNCDHKHKGNWLCTRCHDKKRDNNYKRKLIKQKAWKKWHELNYKPVIEPKKKAKNFNLKEYQKQWRKENIDALLLKEKTIRMMKKWKSCLSIMINWKTRYLPFESL